MKDNSPDQPRTGTVDAINAPSRGTQAIVDCVNEYDRMGDEPARSEAAHVELTALLQENAALRTRLEEAEKRERWIPLATEPAPEMHVRVLITGEEGGVDAIAYLDADGETWRDDYGHRHWPMAWRELPEPYTPSKERDHE